MKIKLATLAITTLLIGSGCATTTQTVPMENQRLNTEMASYIHAEGDLMIEGNALIRQNGGGVVTCAGQEVILLPVTPFTTELISNRYVSVENGYTPFGRGHRGTKIFESIDPTLQDYNRTSLCDAQGNFEFTDLVAGSYYVQTQIQWQVQRNKYYTSNEGGRLMQRVNLDTDKKIVMTTVSTPSRDSATN